MSQSTSNAPTELQRHPGRGLLWSIPLGLGVVLVLIALKVIELNLVPMVAVFVVVLVLGTAWGSFGPARGPKGPPPVSQASRVVPEVSRFDDFDDPARPDEDDAGSGSGDPVEATDETAADGDEREG